MARPFFLIKGIEEKVLRFTLDFLFLEKSSSRLLRTCVIAHGLCRVFVCGLISVRLWSLIAERCRHA